MDNAPLDRATEINLTTYLQVFNVFEYSTDICFCLTLTRLAGSVVGLGKSTLLCFIIVINLMFLFLD